MSAPIFVDRDGNELSVGDVVKAVSVDDGAPGWAHTGRVHSLGWARVNVTWDDWAYEDPTRPFHAVRTYQRVSDKRSAEAFRVIR